MKYRVSICRLWLVAGLLLLLAGCHSFSSDSRRIQHQLNERVAYAEEQTSLLAACLVQHSPLDSLRLIAESDRNLLFYVFDSRKLVYWSGNWLASDEVYLSAYDTWRYHHFSNAHTITRWTRAGEYNVLTVIPIRYDYPLQTQLLRNTFVPPFDVSPRRGVSRTMSDEGTSVYSPAGDYLFSLLPEAEPLDNTEGYAMAAQSFSFRSLLAADEADDIPFWQSRRLHGRLYFILCIVLFAALLLLALVGVVYYRGFRNMHLTTRIMYVLLTCVLAVFIYIFVMSVRYVRENYEQRQRESLLTRSEYVQSYLRSLYYWDVALSSSQTQGLSIDLHDLGYDINQDIHVYSLSGELIASSSSSLFNGGVLSRRMAPEALYSEQHAVLCYERLATHPYLVVYRPFYNGSFVPIGYIAVPSFLSEQTRNQEVDNLLARLLPPYIIVLLLALLFSLWAARSMTAPIRLLIDKMRHFEIGSPDNHIEYPYSDELGELVERYNILVDRVEESAEGLARAEREGAWRTMARQIAHEINNPLTPMKLSVQKLQLKRGTDGFDEYFDRTTKMLIAEIDTLAHIAQSFSTFAKQPDVVTSEVDVAQKLSNVITLQRANDEQIPVRYVGPDSGVVVLADREQISQVFINIIRNAIQALAGEEKSNGKEPDIIVVMNTSYSENEVQISVSDDGPGIPADIREKIFRPNFTTKSNGNGLGLAISKHIVEGSGGRIEFESSNRGTTFFIYLRKK